MSRLRISAISYLNTAPLMWDFERGKAERASFPTASPAQPNSAYGAAVSVAREETAADFDISYTIPSGCARSLAEGAADIGIIPAAAYASTPDLVIIPDIAIAARSAVRSILLVSKIPLDRVRTVALDTSSLTSAALAKILFAKWLGGARAYFEMAPNLDAMLDACDSALLIGDPALQVDRARYITLDLAEEWHARTGKSFVFAFWAIRRAALAGHDRAAIARVFQDSRDHGLMPEHLETIAQEWASRLGLPLESVRTYLARNIHYYLDPPCLEGLKLFYRLGAEIGALPPAPELEFL
jgi:chorismate dehydratase